MAKGNIITEKKETQSLPITLDFKLESHRDQQLIYFREYLRDYMKKWVDENKSRRI
jgi:penicillin-binding protein 1A